MISATRMLCQKYTDLTDGEIAHIESYNAILPALANAGEAVVFLDQAGEVCGYNRAAEALYRDMGYVGDLMGMPGSNIQPAAQAECDGMWHESSVVNRTLQYRRAAVSTGTARSALIIRDITGQRRLEQELSFQ